MNSLSSELFESVRLIGAGVPGPEEGMSTLEGELEGLEEEKNVLVRLFFFLRTFPEPAGALGGGSSIGVRGEISGGNIDKLFLRRLDMMRYTVRQAHAIYETATTLLQTRIQTVLISMGRMKIYVK